MFILIREHRYILSLGLDTHVLRVEELIAGPAPWPGKFRVRLPASMRSEAKTFYGSTGNQAAKKLTVFLSEAR